MVSAVAEILAPISEARQTEIGPLPSDWQVWPLGKLLVQAPSYGINAPAVPYDLRYPAYIRITDITDDGRFNPDGRASVAHPNAQAYHLEDGDIVLARTGASTGKSYRYRTEDGVLAFAGFLIRIRPDKGKLLTLYLSYQLQSAAYWNWVKTNSMRSGQPGINGKQYAAFPLSVPPTIIEQGAIATALSDADGLIEALESLIVKKRAVKQGAMQELLSGRTRLPGFSGAWADRRIGHVLSIQHGKAQRHVAATDGPFPILATGGQIGTAKAYLYDKPSVLIGRKGTIDRPQFVDVPFWTVDTLFYSIMVGENSAKFFFYRFCLIDWYSHNEASGVPSLNARSIEQIELAVPEPDEQQAIVEVLSEMDAELATLETRLAKARAIKQGMMQELLTGRIRLV